VRRRLLASYLVLTVVILGLLEVPLGALYARRERDALVADARRDATALAVLAAEGLEHPGEHDLQALAARYRSETGAEIAVTDPAGRKVVALDPTEPEGNSDLDTEVTAALAGRSQVGRRLDEDGPEVAAAVPVRSETGVLGVVVVALPARPVEARIHRVWSALVVFAVALLGVAAAIGLGLARSLARPLSALAAAAGRLGNGDLETRAPTEGPSEVAEVATQFNAMASRLAELVGGQRQFLADASHQLRTPLTALRLRLENLAADLSGPSAQNLASAEAEVERLSRLVDGLLALSRDQDQTQPEPAVLDVTTVVDERCAAWSALAHEQGATVEVQMPHDRPVRAAVIPGHLEQILDNLLANAVEAGPAGQPIAVVVRDGGQGIEVHVRDHGPGLRPDERKRAFDRFWQANGATTGTSGLGLAIVRQLVVANRGTVTLRDPEGGGLEAVVHLPRPGDGAGTAQDDGQVHPRCRRTPLGTTESPGTSPAFRPPPS